MSSGFAITPPPTDGQYVSKLLAHLPVADRCEAAITISYEALARLQDPIYGCVSHIFALQQQALRFIGIDGESKQWTKTMSSGFAITPPPTDEVTILETREALPTHFLMKVESFSLLGKNKCHKYESGEFIAGGYKWKLILYPNEDKFGIDSKYVSVHLAISNITSFQHVENWEVNAVFSIFLLNQISGNYHYSLGRTHRFQAMKLEWGIPKFISKEILMDPSNGFLIDNTCVFGAEVFIVQKLAVSECVCVKNVTVPYKRDWKISNFSELGHQWTSEKFVVEGLNWDVVLYRTGMNGEKAIRIYLHLIDSKKVTAGFFLCIKDQINNKHKKFTKVSHCFSPASKYSGSTFMKLSALEDPGNGFIIEDCCHLEIEISVQVVV